MAACLQRVAIQDNLRAASSSSETRMRLAFPPPPAWDEADSPRIVLRDGSVATIRPTSRDDLPAMRDFFQGLSPESRYRRFMSASKPPETLLATFCDSSVPAQAFTLAAYRQDRGQTHVIAVGSYFA